jgi:hypothetical protein
VYYTMQWYVGSPRVYRLVDEGVGEAYPVPKWAGCNGGGSWRARSSAVDDDFRKVALVMRP